MSFSLLLLLLSLLNWCIVASTAHTHLWRRRQAQLVVVVVATDLVKNLGIVVLLVVVVVVVLFVNRTEWRR